MNEHVIEVDSSDFEQAVIARSHERPVVVDFWAPWCGPCRTLTPTLEALAAEGEGRWLLAKINTDDNQELAGRYNVRGIPNVKAFRGGEMVAEFVGAQPRSAVQRFLDGILPNALDDQVREAEQRLDAADWEGARALLDAALVERPDHEGAHLARARLALEEGDGALALSHLEAVPEHGPLGVAARQLRARCHFAESGAAAAQGELAARVEAAPGDLDARQALAAAAAQGGDYELAAEQLLAILERDPAHGDGAARQALLDLFVLMGDGDPRTQRYRKRMSWLLFA